MDVSKYEIEITHHALIRAMKRGIHPDLIEDALLKGSVKRYGRHGVKFVNKGSKRTVVCVGQIVGMKIKIFTIEEGNR